MIDDSGLIILMYLAIHSKQACNVTSVVHP
jgi:hypothetical protein